MPSVWDVALAEWPEDEEVYLRESFADYRKRTSAPLTRTLDALSIQSFEGLPGVLRDQHVCVLRLGRGRFALVRTGEADRLRSLFLFDEKLWTEAPRTIAPLHEDLLAVYSLVNRHSETNLINLALASGALGEAIGLDDPRSFPPAATAQSSFTFPVRPLADREVVLDHVHGQVEVDAMFLAELDGTRCLFVLEGKTEPTYSGTRSLYKTKLAYAAKAATQAADFSMPVVPVYLRGHGMARWRSFTSVVVIRSRAALR